jgi:hypothetical protein
MLQSYEHYEKIPELSDIVAQYEQMDARLVTYSSPDTVTHIFFHSLIVDPERAFDGDEDQNGYNMYMTTVDEFKAILNEMYKKGYILISPYDLAYNAGTEAEPKFVYGDIRIPDGKIPFIMSQDDLNYYGYMIGTGNGKDAKPVYVDENNDGFAHKIVIGEDGKPTCEYMDANGNISTGDYDLVPILEKFIDAHPDFCYQGARATLAVCGYDGIFGYRINSEVIEAKGQEYYDNQVAGAKQIVAALQAKGYEIACYTYDNIGYGGKSATDIKEDMAKWEKDIMPVVGTLDTFVYAQKSDISSTGAYSGNKFNVLHDMGFRYFISNGNQPACTIGSNYIRQLRVMVTGTGMAHAATNYSKYFDAKAVLDSTRGDVPQA